MQSFGPGEAAVVRGRWGWYLAYGVLLVAVGLIALYNAIDATLVTVVWVGFMLIFGGVVELVSAFTFPRSLGGRILHIVLGVIYVVAGYMLVFNPISGAVTLTVVVAVMLIIDGLSRLWFTMTNDLSDRGLNLVIGIIDLLLGIWLWTNIPLSALAIGFYVGFALLMAGISWIVVSLRVRSLPDGAAVA